MQTVLIISTGGTIGSFQTEAGYFSVSEKDHFNNPLSQVIETSAQECNQHIIHEQPLSLLSETMMPNHWLMIAQAVRDALAKNSSHQIDRIIITHGSDTLAYTASALAFLLADIDTPILMVAALQPPNEEGSDALVNMRAALLYAQSDLLDYVYVVFSDSDKKVALFPAVLSENIPNYEHHLPTLNDNFFANLSVDDIHQSPPRKIEIKTLIKNFSKIENHDLEKVKTLTHLHEDTVKLFHVYPGFTVKDVMCVIEKSPQCKIVLLNLYHSGTASSEGKNDLTQLLKMCEKNNITVFGLPFDDFYETGKQYETTHELLKNGLFPLPVMSLTTAYTKLVVMAHVYIQEKNSTHEFNEKIKKIMSVNVVGEHV